MWFCPSPVDSSEVWCGHRPPSHMFQHTHGPSSTWKASSVALLTQTPKRAEITLCKSQKCSCYYCEWAKQKKLWLARFVGINADIWLESFAPSAMFTMIITTIMLDAQEVPWHLPYVFSYICHLYGKRNIIKSSTFLLLQRTLWVWDAELKPRLNLKMDPIWAHCHHTHLHPLSMRDTATHKAHYSSFWLVTGL